MSRSATDGRPGTAERFVTENICRPDQVFRLAGFTPSPEINAAIHLAAAPMSRRSLAPLNSGSTFDLKMLCLPFGEAILPSFSSRYPA